MYVMGYKFSLAHYLMRRLYIRSFFCLSFLCHLFHDCCCVCVPFFGQVSQVQFWHRFIDRKCVRFWWRSERVPHYKANAPRVRCSRRSEIRGGCQFCRRFLVTSIRRSSTSSRYSLPCNSSASRMCLQKEKKKKHSTNFQLRMTIRMLT